MAYTQSKTLIPLLILKILEEYSDDKHPLTREEIERLLDEKYHVTMERKAFFRHIKHLNELDDVGICRVNVKSKESGKKTCAGFYLAGRVFTDHELRLIIDSLSGNCFISDLETRELIDQVAGLSSRYFRKKIAHYQFINDRGKTSNSTLTFNLETIDDAIAEKKKIVFDQIRTGKTGVSDIQPFPLGPVTPVQTLVKGQTYYLLFLTNGRLKAYPLRKMANIELTDEQAEDLYATYPRGIDYNGLLQEDPDLSLFHSLHKPQLCTFHCIPDMLADIKAHFGSDLRIFPVQHMNSGLTEDLLEVSVITNPYAAMAFAWENLDTVWLISPDHTNRTLRKRLQHAQNYYQYLEENFHAGVRKDNRK